jgi:hypothetical protein
MREPAADAASGRPDPADGGSGFRDRQSVVGDLGREPENCDQRDVSAPVSQPGPGAGARMAEETEKSRIVSQTVKFNQCGGDGQGGSMRLDP